MSFFSKYFPGVIIHIGYEAGFSVFCLHRYLSAHGINSIVVHAAAVEISVRNRVKTDKRDALKLAIQLSVARLRGIYVPDEDRDRMHTLTRARETLSNDKSCWGNHIKRRRQGY